jgi:hypothetical protein
MRPILFLLCTLLSSGCSKAMSEGEYVEFLTGSHEYLTERQARLESEFRLGSWARWDWDQATGEIVFSDSGRAAVVADVQFVGSVSSRSGTWLWAWANTSVDPLLRTAVEQVRIYGREHGVKKLVEEKWEADEVDGWEMTSISARLLESEGAYRAPKENGATFLLLDNVRWAPGYTPPPPASR